MCLVDRKFLQNRIAKFKIPIFDFKFKVLIALDILKPICLKKYLKIITVKSTNTASISLTINQF